MELIHNNKKVELFNICKINFNNFCIIDSLILDNNIDTYFDNFKEKFIKFIVKIKEKYQIIKDNPL